MNRIPGARTILLAVLFIGFAALFAGAPKVYGQTEPPTVLAAQTPVETLTAPAVSSAPLPSQTDELLKMYGEVLATSKSAIQEIHQTADKVLNLISVIFIALTLGGLGGAWLLSDFAKRASDKSSVAQQKAVEALDMIQKNEARTLELEKRNGSAFEATKELTQKQSDLMTKIGDAEKLLNELQDQINQVKSLGERDRLVLKRPLVLFQIDEYGMQILGGSPEEKNSSILALLELSSRSDAVVRRRAVKAFGVLEEYDERVVRRLNEIIEMDNSKGVCKEAEKSLKRIEAKKPGKTKGRRLQKR